MSPISLLLLSLISLLISPTLSLFLSFEQQLAATETSLRISNYNLFGNAISTSDLRYRLLSLSNSNASFTLFAPLDSTLYSLDMISPATTYTQTLYYHVVNGRHKIEDLQNVCYLDTLLTHYSVLVNQNAGNDTVVDGVAIALPDLFVGPRIVVHGLDGILVPGELGLNELDHNSDHEYHRNLSPSASIESDFHSPPSFGSPVGFESPAISPMSFESPAVSPMRSPRTEPEPVVSQRSSPSPSPSPSPRRSVSRSKNSKRKNRRKVERSKGRRRAAQNGHDRHGRFSKFIDRHGSDF
ncbi:fasciclin-like arabinogalactan protein 19 [Heracleum sosnowskyi]|uniref:Fasciclin-like arabinogalactan protein 19 n=1 Tax=Heracleum sosnowskyi TaxID=360622 RepID=A0AAD8HQY2_9APIA|nr:fasciclin-like arabinogalactan protein 19 [Heracleum sosnowskyi]